jgi:hypothetical protein
MFSLAQNSEIESPLRGMLAAMLAAAAAALVLGLMVKQTPLCECAITFKGASGVSEDRYLPGIGGIVWLENH